MGEEWFAGLLERYCQSPIEITLATAILREFSEATQVMLGGLERFEASDPRLAMTTAVVATRIAQEFGLIDAGDEAMIGCAKAAVELMDDIEPRERQ